MFRRRFFFAALMLAMTLAILGLRDLESGTFATFRDVENISGVAQAGVWTGKITIIKDSIPNSGQGFAFSDDIPNCDIGTRIDDGTATSTVVCNGVPAAAGTGTNYTISETPVAGWQLSNIVCTGDSGYTVGASGLFDSGDTAVTIDLDRGEDVVCTFTNTKLATLVIVKNTVGGNGTFSYLTTGDGLSAFNLTTPGVTATQTFNNLVPGTARSVTESGPPTGWRFTSLSCAITTTGLGTSSWNTITGQSVDNLVLAAGDTVTCTFTNTKDATLVVVKSTIGGNGTFNFSSTGAGITNPFSIVTSGGTGSQTFSNLQPGGSRSVTESSVPSGWVFTSLSCTITVNGGAGPSTWDTITSQSVNNLMLAAGDTVTCTFTNTKLGQIVIIKDAVPNDGQDFSFTTTGTGLSPFSLDDDSDSTLSNTKTFTDVAPGTYTVTEGSPLPSGWSFGGIVCVDPTSNTTTSNQTATINLAAGETVTCTFTNKKNGALVIVKNTVGDNGTFNFTTAGTGLSNFSITTVGNTGSHPFNNLTPGNGRSVTETVPSGWTLTGLTCAVTVQGENASSWTLSSPSVTNITIGAGDTVTCTFTNTRQTGSITIVKDSRTYNGGQTHTEDFAFTTAVSGGAPALSPSTFSLDDDGDNTYSPPAQLSNTQAYAGLSPTGVRSISETTKAGWTITSISCAGATNSTVTYTGATSNPTDAFQSGDNTVNVTLAANENVVCTFVNIEVAPGCSVAGFTQPNPTTVLVPPGGAPFTGGNQDQIIIGTDGPDNITGGTSKDCIMGLGGDDIIHANQGPDAVAGGDGNDLIWGDLGPDILDGGPGTDGCETDNPDTSVTNCETADLDVTIQDDTPPGEDLDISQPTADAYTSKITYRLKNEGPNSLTVTWTGTFSGTSTRTSATASVSGTGSVTCTAGNVTTSGWSCSGTLAGGQQNDITFSIGGGNSPGTVIYTPSATPTCSPVVCTDGTVSVGNFDGSDLNPSDTDTIVP